MTRSEENSATVRDFLAYRHHSSATLYSLSSDRDPRMDDVFLETVEMMGSSKEFFLQEQTELMNY